MINSRMGGGNITCNDHDFTPTHGEIEFINVFRPPPHVEKTCVVHNNVHARVLFPLKRIDSDKVLHSVAVRAIRILYFT